MYLKQKDDRRAITYYRDALPLALYFKNKAVIARLYYNLASAEKNENLQEEAYKHVLLYAKYTDSLKTESISKNIVEMEARFQNEVKEQKIGILNRENERKNLELIQEKKIRWLLAGGVMLSLFALALIYLNYNNKKKTNLQLAKKNQQLDIINSKLNESNLTKTKLFSIISHDLRSPVSQLFSFLKLQQKAPNVFSVAEQELHQQNLIQTSKNLLETMEDLLLWSKSQMENFALDVVTVNIRQLFESSISLLKNQADAKEVYLKINKIDFEQIETDENLIAIIVRNLLQNAINNAQKSTEVNLMAEVSDGGIAMISILNSGAEISEDRINDLLNHSSIESKSSGYGLTIVKELCQKLNATLTIKSNAKFTKISIVFDSLHRF